jgi:hypothetical protein
VTDNLFARAGIGVGVNGPASRIRVFRNTIRHCGTGVAIGLTGRCLLGNLDNATTRDDGGNYFRRSNVLHIDNQSARKVLAQGNDFGTTRRWKINAKIRDRRDDPSLGRVVYSPLMGGELPTEEASVLAIAGALALPADTGGAEIVFSLSAPAAVTVTVLNIAGRPVATVCRERGTDAGVQRVVWNGEAAQGTRTPSGTYVVRIAVRSSDGVQASGLCTLRMER